jgi:hypothetical protein
MTDESRENNDKRKLWDRLLAAQQLKDYAVSENLDIPNHIIEDLNEAFSLGPSEVGGMADKIEFAIRDLTSITYPTTIDTLAATEELRPSRFLWILLILALVILTIAVISHHADTKQYPWCPSILAICLGLQGALVYVFFNLIGVMRARAFDPHATFENVVRIILGGILGWLFFFAFPKVSQGKSANPALVLLPFLVGFSTRLVFGILSKSIRAVELTLGLEDVDTQLMRRVAGRKKPPQQSGVAAGAQ